jgi:tryptophanyl-tRNA synthetase
MEFKVTPWEVEGEVDYDKLISEFGTSPLTQDILVRFEKLTGELHPFLRRKIFFSHRDFDWILDMYEKGVPFAIYTGRGPSGYTHLGHMMPWIFCQYLQEKLDVTMYFQITDDEKYMHRNDLTLEQTRAFAYDNALDFIAQGFDPEKTFVFTDVDYAKTLYRIAVQIAKRVTFSTVKAVFGFTNSTNIGMIFFPAIQGVPCFLPSELENRKVPVVIPAAIDQDPYWRIARDVAEKIGYYKPAAIHNIFLPSLEGPSGKMSASAEESAIFTVDSPEVARRKVMNAFTGGRETLEEQKTLGGTPEVCTVYQYYYFLFEPDDFALEKRRQACTSGDLMCGQCKKELADRLVAYLEDHQRKREKAREVLDQFILRD